MLHAAACTTISGCQAVADLAVGGPHSYAGASGSLAAYKWPVAWAKPAAAACSP
jgi:hypothetical protein